MRHIKEIMIVAVCLMVLSFCVCTGLGIYFMYREGVQEYEDLRTYVTRIPAPISGSLLSPSIMVPLIVNDWEYACTMQRRHKNVIITLFIRYYQLGF